MVKDTKTFESEGKRRGLKYVAANGQLMNNKGEKHLRVENEEGHKCKMNMQITDVHRALMSVSKICDSGHSVTFFKDGGEIKHLQSGQVTKFRRIDDVYRMRVKVYKDTNGGNSAAGFGRQAM